MRWTNLPEMAVEDYFAPKLKKRIEALNAEFARIASNRAALDKIAAEARTANPLEVDFDTLAMLPAHRVTMLQILQAELKARIECDELTRVVYQERQSESTRAHEALQQKEAEVRKALVSIGYLDVGIYSPEIGKILPGDVARHPAVHRARQWLKSVTDKQHDTSGAQLNRDEMRRLQEFLQSAVNAATGG